MKNGALIRLEGVSKQYILGKALVPALRGIDLEIRPKDFLVLAGASGSGKTTLLNLVGLIDSPTAGKIWFGGTCVNGSGVNHLDRFRRDRLGFIFQTFNLVPVFNVYENVEYPLILKGIGGRDRKRRVEEVLLKVGLKDRMKHRPRELSGGQRQRVSIARAVIGNPDIVLADEPTANLDSKTGMEVLGLMEKLNREDGTTFLFSSHDPAIIRKADRVVYLHDGMICRIEAGRGGRP